MAAPRIASVSTPATAGPPATTRIGRRLVAVVLVLAVASGGVAWARSGDSGQAGEPGREARAAATIRALDTAWDNADRPGFRAAAGPGGGGWAARTFANLRALGVSRLSWRYVGTVSSGAPTSVTGTAGSGSPFSGNVELSWRPPPASAGSSRATVTVPFTFRDDGAQVGVVAPQPPVGPLPLWLAGRLRVARVAGGICVTTGSAAELSEVRALVSRAVQQVRNVLGTRPPGVLAVLPNDTATTRLLLGSASSQIAQVAAVTSTVDASSTASSAVQVVLNPALFDLLRPRGEQVVVTHEVTHAVTGATTAAMPLWVAEGFADYVALHDGSTPPRLAARQILAQVRHSGPPRALPSQGDFAAHKPGLGRAYEAAWLVFRLLGQRYGDAATAGFYERVRRGGPVAAALRHTFGIDPAELTASWRHSLDRLASG